MDYLICDLCRDGFPENVEDVVPEDVVLGKRKVDPAAIIHHLGKRDREVTDEGTHILSPSFRQGRHVEITEAKRVW